MIGSTNSILDVKHKQIINYTMLYDYGNECTDLTGGWGGYACTTEKSSQYGKVAPSVTKNVDHIYVTKTKENSLGCLLTTNKIDVSEYTICGVYAYMSSKGNSYAWQRLKMLAGNSGIVTQLASGGGVTNAEKTGIYTIDLANVTDSGYLGIEYYYYQVTTYTRLYMMALFKEDAWGILANKAGIAAGTIAELLDSSSTLLSSEEAVEFMIYNCTGDFMANAIQSETFLTALNNSPYKTKILANEHWAKFLSMVA